HEVTHEQAYVLVLPGDVGEGGEVASSLLGGVVHAVHDWQVVVDGGGHDLLHAADAPAAGDVVGEVVEALALVGAGGGGELVEFLGGVEGEEVSDLLGGSGSYAGVKGEDARHGEAVFGVEDDAEEREGVADVSGAGEAA